jgi:hypothetical protein
MVKFYTKYKISMDLEYAKLLPSSKSKCDRCLDFFGIDGGAVVGCIIVGTGIVMGGLVFMVIWYTWPTCTTVMSNGGYVTRCT